MCVRERVCRYLLPHKVYMQRVVRFFGVVVVVMMGLTRGATLHPIPHPEFSRAHSHPPTQQKKLIMRFWISVIRLWHTIKCLRGQARQSGRLIIVDVFVLSIEMGKSAGNFNNTCAVSVVACVAERDLLVACRRYIPHMFILANQIASVTRALVPVWILV